MNAAEPLARSIVERLQSAGHTAYFAGGCVRDRLMNRAPKDFDVATSATPDQVRKIFPRGQSVGAAFGVILVREKNGAETSQVEIATFRADGAYTDGRHPDSVRFTTAEEDAQRRDFTCNGLFFDPIANQLHDFVGGQADIAAKTLRAIGDAEARFNEDHLRMLRAVRFAARLHFTIEPATRGAIESHAPQIQTISRERIGEEMRSILEHPTRATAVQLLASLHLLEQIWPAEAGGMELAIRLRFDQSKDYFLPWLPLRSSRALALTAMYLDTLPPRSQPSQVASAGDQLQQAFALSNDERDAFLWLCEKLPVITDLQQSRAAHKRILAHPHWPDLRALVHASLRGNPDDLFDAQFERLRAEPGGVAPPPFVTGETLIQLGATPGPKFKQWLEQLYDRQLENEFADAAAAIAAARALVKT